MIKDITLGQYFPGNSFLHRLDPRMKLLMAVFYIVGLFLAKDLFTIVALTLFALLLAPIGKISIKTILVSLKPIRFIIFLTAFFNIFWHKGEMLLFEFKFIHVYVEGLVYAAIIALRVIALLIGSTILISYTTSPIALTDAIERILRPLNKIHVPVHEFAMMMTIALRFIPTLIEETDKIISAQKSRGADFETGNLIQRSKALIPVFIPLLISSVRRADELATAMECRCYHGGKGRTRMKILKFRLCDLLALVFTVLFLGAVIATRFIPVSATFCL
ncbi:MAG: energy-coupling factor transporter transmembrane protein EcfT [Clostridia bacterium]|nr:energy-coupling factor transporter transmembrane protein EcfT [Clostridia bacterium]